MPRTLRILKKLSKRAAPLLKALGDDREQFAAERWENYIGCVIKDHHDDHPQPLKGTIMVGGVTGYYEPEWSEQSAWEALSDIVFWAFSDYDSSTQEMESTRRFRTPSDYLRAAEELASKAATRVGSRHG